MHNGLSAGAVWVRAKTQTGQDEFSAQQPSGQNNWHQLRPTTNASPTNNSVANLSRGDLQPKQNRTSCDQRFIQPHQTAARVQRKPCFG